MKRTLRKIAQPLTLLACVLPLAWLAARAAGVVGPWLGANPVEAIRDALGIGGLRLLLLTLAVRPLATSLRQPWLFGLRRTLGVSAFAYLLLHFLVWLGLEQWFSWSAVLADIVKRPYITVGFLGLVLLLPLALTSTDRALRRLGRDWHRLHRLIYPAAALGCVHFWWQVKADIREPLLYALLLAVLLGWRWRRARMQASALPSGART